jgi:cobalt-precorrin 5A hydrolase
VTRAYLAFTAKGLALAQKLAAAYPGSVTRCGHEAGQVHLADWTARQFAGSDALVFVGAVGIAVRAIAPHCRSKAVDPAVVVLDECGHFAVPILSGHLGGANDLARALAAVCGAVPVITTATDANGVFAVDAWARHQNCAVLEPGRIKRVSSRLLAGGPVRYRSEFPIAGQAPAGVVPAGEAERADFALTLFPAGDALHLIPKIGVLGIGCRRGTSAAQLEAAFAQFCAAHGLAAACITAAASIDLKAHEPGLLEFCRAHGWPVQFYSAAQLQNAPGQFTPSAFVRSVTGVDNVCERAAVLAAGGTIILPKQAGGGVTFALALRPFAPDWRWQDA